MAEFNVVTHKDCEIIDITREINERVPAGLECGICHIFCPHTTAGITVNENADPDVKRDMARQARRTRAEAGSLLPAL